MDVGVREPSRGNGGVVCLALLVCVCLEVGGEGCPVQY